MPYSIKLLIPKQLQQMASNITNLESFYNIFVFQSILQMISPPLKKNSIFTATFNMHAQNVNSNSLWNLVKNYVTNHQTSK